MNCARSCGTKWVMAMTAGGSWRILASVGPHSEIGTFDRLEQADLPAEILGLFLDRVGDVDAVDGDPVITAILLLGRLYCARLHQALEEAEQARAVPVFGRIALKMPK